MIKARLKAGFYLLLSEAVATLEIAVVTWLKWQARNSSATVSACPVSLKHLTLSSRSITSPFLMTVTAHKGTFTFRIRLERKLGDLATTATALPVAREHLSFFVHYLDVVC
tara:strand:- start:8662 stop:8994 length:333 start_codon:yes stop_codon:yes gene_type:complete